MNGEVLVNKSDEFRKYGKQMVDYVCNYMDTIDSRQVTPNVSPGYLSSMMNEEAPEQSESWEDILNDIEKLIMPGITHWQHSHFHAYFPAANSFPSIMADMLSGALGCVGFSWVSCPVYAELEIVMMDWVAKMMNLPKQFLHSENAGGGGVIQGSASDCVIVSMLAARHQAIEQEITKQNLMPSEGFDNMDQIMEARVKVLTKLVGYSSILAHSSVEKNASILFVRIRQLEVDNNFSLRGKVLEEAIKKDAEAGLIPFFVCATLGTTTCCSFDNLEEIGQICQKWGIWLHVDAAYAGSSFICPEFRYLMSGINNVNSININPNKFMLINFDCSLLWVKDSNAIQESMIVDPVYLQHKHSSKAVDFRHWGVPLSRRFRSLKLWFTIRSYGINGLQQYIRNHVKLAKVFANLVEKDERFEIVGQVTLGLVCFRLKEPNSINQCLIRSINESGLLHMTPSVVRDKYIIRFCVCKEDAKLNDIHYAWAVITEVANDILKIKDTLYMEENSYDYINTINNGNYISRIHNTAKWLVNTILSSDAFQHNIKLDMNSNTHKAVDQDKVNSNNNESNALISLSKSINQCKCRLNSVFVCENDLGIGLSKQNYLTHSQRKTLIRMISDPALSPSTIYQSLCFCSEKPVKEDISSPDHVKNRCQTNTDILENSVFDENESCMMTDFGRQKIKNYFSKRSSHVE